MNPQNHKSLSARLNLCMIFTISVFILYILITYHTVCIFPIKKTLKKATANAVASSPSPSLAPSLPTDISHLVFNIAGSIKTWRGRRPYLREWWRPNITRGYIYFDKDQTADILPWPYDYLPQYRVSENTTKLKVHSKHMMPHVIRIVRTILETFREGDKDDVRWYVMGDDDTIFFLDNLVRLLGRYDHTKYVYIGGVSECIKSGFDVTFEMAFGGAGSVVSYPLAEALVANLDRCLETYPNYFFGDQILGSCIADLGVPFISERGFHQIDLMNDISGFLSAHPQAPLISLHHLDNASPIFPDMDRHKSVKHLMTAATVDQSRLLQQTVCYHKQKNWAFSIAWGYSAYIYEQLIPRSILRRPFETFTPWSFIGDPPHYMFNTRSVTNNSCETPHIFFFSSITRLHNSNNNSAAYEIMSTYVRYKARELAPCSSNHSADYISEIRVYSPATKLDFAENRGECCDVVSVDDNKTAEVRIRGFKKTEMIIA